MIVMINLQILGHWAREKDGLNMDNFSRRAKGPSDLRKDRGMLHCFECRIVMLYWRYCFEYAAIRGAIHCHGLAKLSDHNFASKGVLAKKIREELMEGDDPMWDEQRHILQDGFEAGKIICNSYDSLISCMNPVLNEC